METICTVLKTGSLAPVARKKEPIEFKYVLEGLDINETSIAPSAYTHIELVCLKHCRMPYTDKTLALMFAYNCNSKKGRDIGNLFLGFWNDGVV